MNSTPRLLLASNSPRRRQLLSDAGYSFDVEVIPVVEDYPVGIELNQIAKYLAVKKNKAYREKFTNYLIVTADTTVICDKQLLEKAGNSEEAIEMLLKLSGRTHIVTTGVCLFYHEKEYAFDVDSQVTFAPLALAEIQHYVSLFHPFDKAGAYGIQEWIGLIGVKEIHGSFYNIMGLPIHELYQALKNQYDINPFQ